MKNCIVKIIDNAFEKMTKVGYFLQGLAQDQTARVILRYTGCFIKNVIPILHAKLFTIHNRFLSQIASSQAAEQMMSGFAVIQTSSNENSMYCQ